MSYPLPLVPELNVLVRALERYSVEIHLRGYLQDSAFPFVDICHDAAARLYGGEPNGFRFIYPFPVSNQACIDGLPDPLQGECRDLALALQENKPHGYGDRIYQRCFSGLLEQAEYVTQFTPSRLVLIEDTVDESVIEQWLSRL